MTARLPNPMSENDPRAELDEISCLVREIDDLRARLAAAEQERYKWRHEYNTLKETSISPLVRRAERAEYLMACANTPLMKQVLDDRETWKARAEQWKTDAERGWLAYSAALRMTAHLRSSSSPPGILFDQLASARNDKAAHDATVAEETQA